MKNDNPSCLEYFIVGLIILAAIMGIFGCQIFAFRTAWNYLLVDTFHVFSQYLSVKATVTLLTLVWLVGLYFRSSKS